MTIPVDLTQKPPNSLCGPTANNVLIFFPLPPPTFFFIILLLFLDHYKVKVAKEPLQGDNAFDYVVSTIYSKDLSQISKPPLRNFRYTEAVSMETVTLWYPREDLVDPASMGYLIPLNDPENTQCALGVLFDSNLIPAKLSREPAGTKLCVLMGGHYYGDKPKALSEAASISRARSVLHHHLNIPPEEPSLAVASGLQYNCIPQKTVGHHTRMAAAHDELQRSFSGRLLVAGPSYTGAGILGSIRAGYDVAKRLVGVEVPHVGETGLRGFTRTGLVVTTPENLKRIRPNAFNSFFNPPALG